MNGCDQVLADWYELELYNDGSSAGREPKWVTLEVHDYTPRRVSHDHYQPDDPAEVDFTVTKCVDYNGMSLDVDEHDYEVLHEMLVEEMES